MNHHPAVITANECRKLPEADWRFLTTSVLHQAPASKYAECLDCGDPHETRIELDLEQRPHTYLLCPVYGPSQIDPRVLLRWTVEPNIVLQRIFASVLPQLAATELIAGMLWRVGLATLLGKRWELAFVRNPGRDRDRRAETLLAKRRKTTVLTPLEVDAVAWSRILPNTVISLESISDLVDGQIRFDDEHFAGQLAMSEIGTKPATIKTKRSAGFGKIVALKQVLCEHVRAARDHAIATMDQTGSPKLLPFPTNQHLAGMAGLRGYEVTRCFQDRDGNEVRFLRDVAQDLVRLLEHRG